MHFRAFCFALPDTLKKRYNNRDTNGNVCFRMLEYGKEPGTWMRILIVDDDALQRRLLRAQLNKGDHDIWEVTDGAAAWELWQEQPIQLVITDWMMPRMDGVELTRRIRAASTSAYTYIIMLTGRSDRNDIVDGLESGADDYLVKPFNPRELLSRVAIGMRIISLEMRLRESLHELHRMATHDSLTGVFNRHAIYEYAAAEVERTQREVTSVSLVLIDVDHFKNINDTYGHPVGDQARRLSATAPTAPLRPGGALGRRRVFAGAAGHNAGRSWRDCRTCSCNHRADWLFAPA